LGLSALVSEAFLGFEATAFGGFGLFLGVSYRPSENDAVTSGKVAL
jgi:hypothetical protein